MKYAKYILFLVALIAVSCTIEDDFTNNGGNNSGKIQFVSRIVPFEGYDVFTRAASGTSPSETDLLSLDYVILAKLQGDGTASEDFRCIYYRHYGEDNVNEIITIDVETDFHDITEALGDDVLDSCYVAVLANYSGLYDAIEADAADANADVDDYIADHIVFKGENFADYEGRDYFQTKSQAVEAIAGVPSTGLPRLGNYKDATTGSGLIDLRALQGGSTYSVYLESLYAKMVFDIVVKATQEPVGAGGNTFALESFTIDNLATTIDLMGGTESGKGLADGTDDDVAVHTTTISGDDGLIDRDSETDRNVQFVCYLPERFTRAKYGAHSAHGQYPFAPDGNIRPEDTVLCQRYKPLIAQDDATYVTFKGIFVNHQGHSFDVSYKIYVGNDNYSNFDVVRNRQYNNSIIIKGIENSSDQSEVEGSVSIDHRVDVARTLPIIINLRRETLLDAHFEVRPMRIRANTNHTGGSTQTNAAVMVEVVYNSDDPALNDPTKRWIGLERSYGDGVQPNSSDTYCIANDVADDLGASSNGKRKYFTTDLTYNTLNQMLTDATRGELLDENTGYSKAGGQAVIIPVDANDADGECVWIYVDECLMASTDLYKVRSAKIKVTNGYLDGTNSFQPSATEDPIVYTINQHYLYKVEFDGREYYIEHEEEYLHNFDADDTYADNQTEFEGMEWGLYNTQLSFRNGALFFDSQFDLLETVINLIKQWAGVNPVYDFYVKTHDTSVSSLATKHEFNGLNFSKNIINDINGVTPANVTGYEGRNERADNIKVLQLNQLPHSAIEYCYNRNKRDSDGLIDTDNITWYMPAIDEMEDVMMGAHGQFLEFQDKFYWSSQPAYLRHMAYYDMFPYVYGDYYIDDAGIYNVSDQEKSVTKVVGRARATKAEWTGPRPEDFDSVPSGLPVNVYDDYIRVYFDDWRIKTESSYSEIKNGKQLYDWGGYDAEDPTTWMKYDEGNKLRSEKCRVRALVDKSKVTVVD